MNCSLVDCLGEYEEKEVVHTVRYRGEVVVFDGVPAEVCSICGDILFRPETVRQIERLLRMPTKPAQMIPLYDFMPAVG